MPVTVTAAHIHTGTVGMNGGVAINLNVAGPIMITDTQVIASGVVTLTAAQEATMLEEGYYFNIHTTANPAGEMRAQVPAVTGDGASNAAFVDEIRLPQYNVIDGSASGFTPLMTYPSPANVEDGIVAMMRREQPSLENPGVSSNVRSIYTTFGLESVNNGTGVSRAALLGAFMDMLMDEPMASVSIDGDTFGNDSDEILFSAELTSNIESAAGSTYRWDFGDGSPILDSRTVSTVSHSFPEGSCGGFTVTVEITDSLGNVAIGEVQTPVCGGQFLGSQIFFPFAANGE